MFGPLYPLQAKGFHGEIEDLQQWLTDTERHLLASKPLGGLPETAKEQLNAHLVGIVVLSALGSYEQTEYFAWTLMMHKLCEIHRFMSEITIDIY